MAVCITFLPYRIPVGCPQGWHTPTEDDWLTLGRFLAPGTGGKLKEEGTAHWTTPNEGPTNNFGFTVTSALAYPEAGLSIRCIKE